MNQYTRLLTIAASDSGGGAGIQADLKTFAALGCYGMSVITAVTAQNTLGISNMYPISPEFVNKQIKAIMSDIGVDAIKIGALLSQENMSSIIKIIEIYNVKQIVIDPLIFSTTGTRLLDENAIDFFKTKFSPLGTIITPNLQEAAILLDYPIDSFLHAEINELKSICRKLRDYTGKAVILKGGHSLHQQQINQSIDLLYLKGENKFFTFTSEYIKTSNTHGTGCTFSSAIASFLARKFSIYEAVNNAKEFITGAIKAGSKYQIGRGKGPIHHFYRDWV